MEDGHRKRTVMMEYHVNSLGEGAIVSFTVTAADQTKRGDGGHKSYLVKILIPLTKKLLATGCARNLAPTTPFVFGAFSSVVRLVTCTAISRWIQLLVRNTIVAPEGKSYCLFWKAGLSRGINGRQLVDVLIVPALDGAQRGITCWAGERLAFENDVVGVFTRELT